MSNKLFQPLTVGSIKLSHRIVMAPLTRFRADDEHVPLPFVKTYYEQRASVPGTLLITEATFISPRASGYPNAPGIWSDAQVQAWKEVTDAVHAKKSFIFLQLWALGRTANKANLEAKGFPVVSSSATKMTEASPEAHPLSEEEIQQFIADYAQGARNAIEAGFDGVEIHGANGYLIDQFLQDVTNQRTDGWGGSVENRARFGLEVAQAVVKAVGADRVGIRLSPWSSFQGMGMKDPIPQFGYMIRGLKQLGLAYLHCVESRSQARLGEDFFQDPEITGTLDFALEAWGKGAPFFMAGGFDPELAHKTVNEEYSDADVAIVFGRSFISTPDLPFRIERGIAPEKYNRATFYSARSEEGYTDYPFSPEFQALAGKI